MKTALTVLVVLTVAAVSLPSCQQEEINMDHSGPVDKVNLPYVVELGNVEFLCRIECWGTGLHSYEDGIYDTPAYDPVSVDSWRYIYYRRYTVSVRPEPRGDWQYIGWGVVTDTLWLVREKLDPEYIELDNCE